MTILILLVALLIGALILTTPTECWQRFDIGYDQGWVDSRTKREVPDPVCHCGRPAAWCVDNEVIEFYCRERAHDGGKRDCGYRKVVRRGDVG